MPDLGEAQLYLLQDAQAWQHIHTYSGECIAFLTINNI
jgi:hypothetical protein